MSVKRELAGKWADLLSSELNRPAADIRAHGLRATDFPAGHALRLEFADGSRILFKYAVYAVDEQLGTLAVFTEHCGYHEFPAGGTTVVFVHESWEYPK